jgi:hypothetical protein
MACLRRVQAAVTNSRLSENNSVDLYTHQGQSVKHFGKIGFRKTAEASKKLPRPDGHSDELLEQVGILCVWLAARLHGPTGRKVSQLCLDAEPHTIPTLAPPARAGVSFGRLRHTAGKNT